MTAASADSKSMAIDNKAVIMEMGYRWIDFQNILSLFKANMELIELVITDTSQIENMVAHLVSNDVTYEEIKELNWPILKSFRKYTSNNLARHDLPFLNAMTNLLPKDLLTIKSYHAIKPRKYPYDIKARNKYTDEITTLLKMYFQLQEKIYKALCELPEEDYCDIGDDSSYNDFSWFAAGAGMPLNPLQQLAIHKIAPASHRELEQYIKRWKDLGCPQGEEALMEALISSL
jgi:hypothetical protein